MSLDQALENLKFEYEHLSQKSIPTLINCYALQACFKDPFQEVVGHIAITEIFEHMFNQLDHPTFIIRQTLIKDLDVALLWDFRFSLKRWNKNPPCFEGVSWLRFNQDFLVEKHQDFWDPAEGIYEKLPLIGPIMRGLKRSA